MKLPTFLLKSGLAASLLTSLLLPACPAQAGASPAPRATVGAAGSASRASASAASAVRIDPTFWWVGMKNPRLQLLVHGPGVAGSTVSLSSYAGVTLDGVQQLASPNYLLLNLTIGPEARPGQLKLGFKGPRKFTYT